MIRRSSANEQKSMRRLVVPFLTLFVVVGLMSLSGVASARRTAPKLLDRDCGAIPPGFIRHLTCSWLVVPEDRDRASSPTIKLAVIVLPSRSPTPEPDPVVFLAGGPGDPGIEGYESFANSPMLEHRNLILFDQRGTGLSEPSLDCPERVDAARVDLGRAESPEFELRGLADATAACRKRLERDGVDLDAYNTEASAADVADLREALGLDEWNLYGVSYGTRLALATMRSHPTGIRSVVLDSVYPTDVGGLQIYTEGAKAAFDRLVTACNADVSCAALQPHLDQILQALVERYNETPAEITLSTGDRLVLTGDDIYAGLFDAMRNTDIIPALPTLMESIGEGNLGLLEVQAEQGVTAVSTPMKGMFLSTECADAGKFADARRDVQRAAGAETPTSVLVRYSAQPYCYEWGVKPLPDSFSRPVRSKIPALVLAGSLDPITPASDSKRAAKTLSHSVYVEFAGFGHGVTNGLDCPRAIREAFLNNPRTLLDTSCADAPAPAFLSQGLI